jgi:hypothetical protein
MNGIGPDSDDEVSIPSCSTDGEESDNGGSGSDADCFSTISLEGPNYAGEASKDSGPAGFEAVEGIELGFGGSSEGLELGLGQIAECDVVDAAVLPKPPKGRSIVHNVLTDGSAVFLCFDIEIGGKYVGIIQLSAELVPMKLVAGRGVVQDQSEEVTRVETFDSYVKPNCNIWDLRCIDIHQIHPDDECIVSAHNINHVWGQFKTWLNRNVGISETIILVTWNGETCDLKWLWKITQSLLNYGIGLDWDGVSGKRPSYMRTGAFKPCECKKCFFCLKGHTNGITLCPRKQAKVTVEYKCGMRVITKKCTDIE